MDKNMVEEMQNLVKRIGDLAPEFIEGIKEVKKAFGVLEEGDDDVASPKLDGKWCHIGNLIRAGNMTTFAADGMAAKAIVNAHNATLATPELELSIRVKNGNTSQRRVVAALI